MSSTFLTVGINVLRPANVETTALGAAIAAGRAAGVWDIETVKTEDKKADKKFTPDMDQKERDRRFSLWNKAVKKAFESRE